MAPKYWQRMWLGRSLHSSQVNYAMILACLVRPRSWATQRTTTATYGYPCAVVAVSQPNVQFHVHYGWMTGSNIPQIIALFRGPLHNNVFLPRKAPWPRVLCAWAEDCVLHNMKCNIVNWHECQDGWDGTGINIIIRSRLNVLLIQPWQHSSPEDGLIRERVGKCSNKYASNWGRNVIKVNFAEDKE